MIVTVDTPVVTSARVLQVSGIFDLPPAERSHRQWNVQMPLTERPWSIGLIVGPSGCGKSTIARQIWPAEFSSTFAWDPKRSLLDSFPSELGIQEIVAHLSSVGFSSPPDWVKPFHVLSNGQQFRATMARHLAEPTSLAVIDEFTSVVDRTVAQIGSAALAKAVRRGKKQLIAVTCHDDVEAWLNPDWIYEPATESFRWRELQRRPAITLDIRRVHWGAWRLFHPHHYLTSEINHAAACFCAFWNGRPVAFDAWLPFFGRLTHGRARRGHRTVCLPDYQGVGIGAALFSHLASMWAGLGYRAFSATAHPAEIASRLRNPSWRCTRPPGRTARDTSSGGASMARSRPTE
jgi:GNAT superfamily N-acetyltransferase